MKNFQRRIGSSLAIKTFISLLFAGFVTSNFAGPTFATSDRINIEEVTVVNSVGTSHRVELRGTFSTDIPTKGVRLNLITYGPLKTRSELANFLENSNQVIGRLQSGVTTEIIDPQPESKTGWQLKFNAEKIFGANASGVYLIGVRKRDSDLQSNFVLPWFYNSTGVKKTKVLFFAQIAVQDTHLADGRVRYLNRDARHLSRLNALTSSGAKNVTYLVDRGVTNWLADLNGSALEPAANQVGEQLAARATSSETQIYNHTNLQGLLSSNPGDIRNVIRQSESSGNNNIFYLPKFGRVGADALSNLANLTRIVPILSNTAVLGNASNTSSAVAKVNEVPSIIYDAATSRCFSLASTWAVDTCVSANISMITAESPYLGRTIAILTPPFWEAEDGELARIAQTIQKSRWGKVIKASKNLISSDAPSHYLSGPNNKLPKGVLRNSNQLLRQAKILGNSITEETFVTKYELVRLRSFSELNPKTESAKYFLRANQQLLDWTRSGIAIRTSTRITVATNKTDIPLTISNQSGFPIRVKARLTSASKSQFAEVTSDLIDVPNNQRVTVPVTVELAGTGNVPVTVSLLNAQNQKLGISQNISLTSSSYQSLARTLVWGACGLLLLFAIVNVARKRWRPETMDEQ